jgi:hypothetical protein
MQSWGGKNRVMLNRKKLTKQNVFEHVPLVVATVVAVSLMLSIARQYGFFSQVDGRLMAFLSVEDILRNTVYYIPASFISLFLGPAYRLFEKTNKSDAPLRPPPSKLMLWVIGQFFSPLRRGDLVFVLILIAFSVIFLEGWPYVVAFLIVLNFTNLLSTVALSDKLRFFPFRIEGAFIVLTVLLFWLYGIAEGQSAADSKPDYVMVLDDGSKQPVALLRVGAQFTLVAGEDGHLQQIANSSIQRLTQITPPHHQPLVTLPDVALGDIWAALGNWFSPPPIASPGDGSEEAPV